MRQIAVRSAMVVVALTVTFVFLSANTASAQGVGIKGGLSSDPDQFFVGIDYETAPLVDRLRFRPGVDVGVGDDLTLVTLNFDLVYKVPFQRSPWSVYFGGGPAANFYRFDGGGDDVEGAFRVLFGLAHSRGFFTEFVVGAHDAPDFKVGVGYRFR